MRAVAPHLAVFHCGGAMAPSDIDDKSNVWVIQMDYRKPSENDYSDFFGRYNYGNNSDN